ncbi:MAG: hypothetical protein KKC55_15575 [Gammaproteobacteria bacterium]|nr:hypothetical protein [Gammaproteobacteria bacterium]
MPNVYFPIIVKEKEGYLGVEIVGSISDKLQFLMPGSLVRIIIYWHVIEATKGTYAWSSDLDAGLAAVRAKNCRILLNLTGCPTWARLYPRPCSPPKQKNFQDYVNFVKAVCARYSPNFVELWNEPDVDKDYLDPACYWMGCWGDEDDTYYGGTYYGKMLKLAYPAIRVAYPHVGVFAGSLLLPRDGTPAGNKQDKFILGALSVPGANCDYISFHSYTRYPNTGYDRPFQKADWLLANTGHKSFMTETSLLSNTDGAVFRSAQASYFQHLCQNFRSPLVGFIWYTLANHEYMNSDMVKNNLKQPVWNKYQEAMSW